MSFGSAAPIPWRHTLLGADLGLLFDKVVMTRILRGVYKVLIAKSLLNCLVTAVSLKGLVPRETPLSLRAERKI